MSDEISSLPPEPGSSPPERPLSPGVTPTAPLPGARPGPWQPPTPEELQSQIPQYKILGLLGRGGMGAVYQGWQTSLERNVAVKILPQILDDGDASFAARFKMEAKTMARLSHPCIVPVFDAGETTGGLLYFVMEFIEGTDVSQMLKAQRKLQPAHALAITAHVCDALTYAREHGVIHRDIKPANVMLNMEGQVKVADFGLAKATAQETGGLTRASMTMGTPDFMAPEALTTGLTVDHRADLYAVGVMLYQMLTGKVPRGIVEMPSKRVEGVNPRFDAIVLKAMKEEREQRYQSAREMRRDLDVILMTPTAKPQQRAPVRDVIPHTYGIGVLRVDGTFRFVAKQGIPVPPEVAVGVKSVFPAGKYWQILKEDGTGLQIAVGDEDLNTRTTAAAITLSGSRIQGVSELRGAAFTSVWKTRTGVWITGREERRLLVDELNKLNPATFSISVAQWGDRLLYIEPNEAAGTSSQVSTPSRQLLSSQPVPVSGSLKAASVELTGTMVKVFPKFDHPPGKWARLFQGTDDLPDGLLQPQTGVKWQDGWLSSADRIFYVQYSRKTAKGVTANQGIRATFGGTIGEGTGRLRVRGGNNPRGGAFRSYDAVSDKKKVDYTVSLGTDSPPYEILTGTNPWPGVDVKQPHTSELAVIGSRLYARMNGKLVTVTDDRIADGMPGFLVRKASIRDVEVINLDGLSEAEALKIIGVDEKGNDVRAAAVPSP